ncbi:hypothetical protein HID58_017822 [Brassica napus]|uniref:Uncharacterized protein n=1 Tax=Brassica napus TaxID=3708 RepID=A0ABQ8DAZ7_BRANA|nr:hypothetical protein HID58_017822 [Brassica napus]
MRQRILGGEPMGVYILHLGVKSIAIEEKNLIMLPLVVLLLISICHAIFEVSNCFMVKLDIFLQICQRES